MSENKKVQPGKTTSSEKTPAKKETKSTEAKSATKPPTTEVKSTVKTQITIGKQSLSSEHAGSEQQPSKSLMRSVSWGATDTAETSKRSVPTPKKSTPPKASTGKSTTPSSAKSMKLPTSNSANSESAKSFQLKSTAAKQPPKKQVPAKTQTPKMHAAKIPAVTLPKTSVVKSPTGKSTSTSPAKSRSSKSTPSKTPPVSPENAASPKSSSVVPAKSSASTAVMSQPKPVEVPAEILSLPIDQIVAKLRDLENVIKMHNTKLTHLRHDMQNTSEKIRLNTERVKASAKLPFMVATLVEVLETDNSLDPEEHEGGTANESSKAKCAVIKTSSRTTYFLPNLGLLDITKIKPGDLVGVNKDSHIIYELLPAEYDSRIKSMELVERPKEQFDDIGGLENQIQEIKEAILWPLQKKEKFEKMKIAPPKGVLLYGPPGTGKTMMARTVAAQTKCAFLKLAGSQLVQMFIGDGAKLVRDAFALAKEKAPTIIFIDEIDALGTKRYNSEKTGDREVQRTMLELLSQLDGFQPNDNIKVIAATNRVDTLDPALVRSGRLDRKIELALPDQRSRVRIMQIHSKKMTVDKNVNFDELSQCMDDFNGAQCKAVCVEAGMIALRRNATIITHEDFMDGILEVQAKKKANLNYYI